MNKIVTEEWKKFKLQNKNYKILPFQGFYVPLHGWHCSRLAGVGFVTPSKESLNLPNKQQKIGATGKTQIPMSTLACASGKPATYDGCKEKSPGLLHPTKEDSSLNPFLGKDGRDDAGVGTPCR